MINLYGSFSTLAIFLDIGFISTIFNFTKRFSIDLESLADGENGLPSGLSPNDVRLRVPVGVAGDLYRIDVCLELVLVGALLKLQCRGIHDI